MKHFFFFNKSKGFVKTTTKKMCGQSEARNISSGRLKP